MGSTGSCNQVAYGSEIGCRFNHRILLCAGILEESLKDSRNILERFLYGSVVCEINGNSWVSTRGPRLTAPAAWAPAGTAASLVPATLARATSARATSARAITTAAT